LDWRILYTIGKLLKCRCLKWAPFGYSKHKLWPKERPRIKLPIWLSTIKSQELPWFSCVQVMCHISLESSRWRIQLCFTPHFNWRSTHKVMGFQSFRSPNFENFETPNLGVRGQNDIWVLALWLNTKNTIRRKVVASPKSRPWWVLWVRVCLWFVHTPKVFQLCTNQLVVWFVQVNVNNWPTCHSS
jgi:hypothetical protein